jgi:hypothetical protein
MHRARTLVKSRQRIQEILAAFKLDRRVRVEFPHAEVQRYGSTGDSKVESEPETDPKLGPRRRELPFVETGVFCREVLTLPSLPGQSLALNENLETSGTFGGFFEIVLPGSSQAKVVAITCFHVINPVEKGRSYSDVQTIRRWRMHGMRPSRQRAMQLLVDHPSPRAVREKGRALQGQTEEIVNDLKFQLWCQLETNEEGLTSGAQKMLDARRKELANLRSFLNEVHSFDPSFGRVWAASGFRTERSASIENGGHKYTSQRDWALIEIPRDRVGRNIVSSITNHLYHTRYI